MSIINGVESVCAGQYFGHDASASQLYDAGLPSSTGILRTVGNCSQRPRTEGGPATAEPCDGCGLRVRTKVAEGLRAMARRVNSRRSPLEQ